MIHLETTPDGQLDPGKTSNLLKEAERRFEFWEGNEIKFPNEQIILTIEMGVPFLNKWISDRSPEVPAITVGDQVWSMVLQKSLELSGEFDEEASKVIRSLAEFERCCSEAWFLPLLAPREYIDYYAAAHIPVHYLPGLFGQRLSEEELKSQIPDAERRMLDNYRENGQKIRVVPQ